MSTTNTSGRRKTAVARIYLTAGNGNITVNGKDYKEYFPTLPLQYIVTQSLLVADSLANFDINVNVQGGGVKGQAEAVRLAIAKALVELNPEVKPALRSKGLMTRDDRMVERKKPGRRKARRRFQFSKR
ncbi:MULTISPECIES: 30S ribosomal protein S9 [Sphingobacterium]|uniref:Small ribosomal subunit protein uS9 n=1 Tax=Sphingobacterium cellulitidis TaxID=1768011 RepID=A0A8H9G041_9SPHI|nr:MULTISPECIES: 30S ribosomal protein S9 [Sphingobacterium]MBA8987645.1 small subunit ribosomal protein S9 [Sphingobacterium soli]MBV2228557.1 30S ribosomal protein S9 [Sphingobacterium mizutaii]OYD43573.1 30S ribosomal protein S9 [Sphingobacterium cellulitidis]OYD46038.1 30S ribosomal protein S9 [Sphingobacterium cellulitidis]WFB64318.1 30S ribosomal protein S9 [Sphingobacterium sp. WM]